MNGVLSAVSNSFLKTYWHSTCRNFMHRNGLISTLNKALKTAQFSLGKEKTKLTQLICYEVK